MHSNKLETSTTNLWQLIVIDRGVKSLLGISLKETFGKKNEINHQIHHERLFKFWWKKKEENNHKTIISGQDFDTNSDQIELVWKLHD